MSFGERVSRWEGGARVCTLEVCNLERKTMSSHGDRNTLKINIVTVSLILVIHPFPFYLPVRLPSFSY